MHKAQWLARTAPRVLQRGFYGAWGATGIYPIEFLNTLSFLGVPPHELHLQEGCPTILLRNMTSGLANGTKLIVIQLMQHVIEAEVATSLTKGQ